MNLKQLLQPKLNSSILDAESLQGEALWKSVELAQRLRHRVRGKPHLSRRPQRRSADAGMRGFQGRRFRPPRWLGSISPYLAASALDLYDTAVPVVRRWHFGENALIAAGRRGYDPNPAAGRVKELWLCHSR